MTKTFEEYMYESGMKGVSDITKTVLEFHSKHPIKELSDFAAQSVREDRESRWISVEKELPQIPAMTYMSMIGGGMPFFVLASDGESVWPTTHGGDPAIWKVNNPEAKLWSYLPPPPTKVVFE